MSNKTKLVFAENARSRMSPSGNIKAFQDSYVLELALLPSKNVVAASASDGSVTLYDSHNLGKTSTLRRSDLNQEASVTSIGTIENDSNLLVGTTKDSKAIVWDIRSGKSVLSLSGPHNKPYLCHTTNDHIIGVGTENVNHETRIDLWDMRKSTLYRSYSECHSEDVTSLSFHSRSEFLLSGSVDGLFSIIDTRIEDEDDALVKTGNMEASVHLAEWLYPEHNSKVEPIFRGIEPTKSGDEEEDEQFAFSNSGVIALSHIETMSAFYANETQLVYDAGDVRNIEITNNWKTDYVIDIDTYADCPLTLFCGTFTGKLAIITVHDRENWTLDHVLTGHEDLIRSVKVDHSQSNLVVYSAGEDGQICCWRASARKRRPSSPTAMEIDESPKRSRT